jgi:hypothetical protein
MNRDPLGRDLLAEALGTPGLPLPLRRGPFESQPTAQAWADALRRDFPGLRIGPVRKRRRGFFVRVDGTLLDIMYRWIVNTCIKVEDERCLKELRAIGGGS